MLLTHFVNWMIGIVTFNRTLVFCVCIQLYYDWARKDGNCQYFFFFSLLPSNVPWFTKSLKICLKISFYYIVISECQFHFTPFNYDYLYFFSTIVFWRVVPNLKLTNMVFVCETFGQTHSEAIDRLFLHTIQSAEIILIVNGYNWKPNILLDLILEARKKTDSLQCASQFHEKENMLMRSLCVVSEWAAARFTRTPNYLYLE